MAELSLQKAEEFIRKNPKQADALAFEYHQFLKNHPETLLTDFPQSVLDGKAISEAYYYLRDQHEDNQMQTNGQVDVANIPLGLVGVTVLMAGYLQRPKIMQDDKDYQKIERQLEKEWLKKNKAKDFLSKEGLDYLYGSLDDNTMASLRKEAEEIFRNNPKFKNRIERYDREKKKIYKDREKDPEWQLYERNVQAEIDDRFALLEKRTSKTTALKIPKEEFEKYQQEISEQVEKKHHEEFTRKNPEKRKAYLKNVAEDIEEEKARLTEYNEGLMGETGAPEEEMREIIGGQPTRVTHITNVPSPTNIQGEHTPLPSRSSEDGISSQIVNAANKFPRGIPRNPFGKIGSRAAVRVSSRLATFFLSPTGWVVIALALVVVFTVIIMSSPGAAPLENETPPQKTNDQTVNAIPTETITPTTPTEETTPAPAAP